LLLSILTAKLSVFCFNNCNGTAVKVQTAVFAMMPVAWYDFREWTFWWQEFKPHNRNKFFLAFIYIFFYNKFIHKPYKHDWQNPTIWSYCILIYWRYSYLHSFAKIIPHLNSCINLQSLFSKFFIYLFFNKYTCLWQHNQPQGVSKSK
jgi:hypothetical protein